MKEKFGFLREASGGLSSTRLIFMVGSIWNMALCSYLVLTGIEAGALVATFAALQGVFVGLKLGQKPMENNSEKNKQ